MIKLERHDPQDSFIGKLKEPAFIGRGAWQAGHLSSIDRRRKCKLKRVMKTTIPPISASGTRTKCRTGMKTNKIAANQQIPRATNAASNRAGGARRSTSIDES